MSELIIKNLKVKAVIFDLDGTVLDSCGIWSIIDKKFFSKRNAILPNDYPKTVSTLGLKKAAVYTKKLLNLKESPDDIEKEWLDECLDLYKNSVNLKPFAFEFIKKCSESGITVSVATANSKECYEPCLKRNKIYDFFDLIVDVKQYKNGKTSPEIFLDLAEKICANPKDILIFEDSLTPIKVAKEVGFKVCGVKEMAWGETDDKEKKNISDLYIENFKELLEE